MTKAAKITLLLVGTLFATAWINKLNPQHTPEVAIKEIPKVKDAAMEKAYKDYCKAEAHKVNTRNLYRAGGMSGAEYDAIVGK